MRKVFFSLVVSCILSFTSVVGAATHDLRYNSPKSIHLSEGDTLYFKNFPIGWPYTKVKLGVRGEPSQMLDGILKVGSCAYPLNGYYIELEMNYSQGMYAIYHGPTKTYPMHWWVDYGPAVSCYVDSAELKRGQTLAMFDSLYEDYTKNYIDLNGLESVSHFSGASGLFKITHLPQFFFNAVHILVEPEDGFPLDGSIYFKGVEYNVEGWSSNIAIPIDMGRYVYFELAFPEYRHVRLKWWVTSENLGEIELAFDVNEISIDSIEVSYQFGLVESLDEKIKLRYARSDFLDGQPPTIRVLKNNPHGNELKDSAFFPLSEIFDIHANASAGKYIQMAIPLNVDMPVNVENVAVKHFDTSLQKWINEPIDSVSNGYVYFRTSTFSSFFIDFIGFIGTAPFIGVGIAADCWFFDCKSGDVALSAGKTYIKWTKKTKDTFVDMICSAVDVDPFAVKFVLNDPLSKAKSRWDIVQGKITDLQALSNLSGRSVFARLHSKILSESEREMQKFEFDDEPESERWRKASMNLDVLLADKYKLENDWNNEVLQLGHASIELPLKRIVGYRNYGIGVNGLKFEYVGKTEVPMEFSFNNYLMPKSSLLEGISWFRDGIAQCYQENDFWNYESKDQWQIFKENILNVDTHEGTCKNVLNMFTPSGPIDYIFPLNRGCNEFLTDLVAKEDFVSDMLNDRDQKLIYMSSVMARVALLSWIDKTDFRKFAAVAYRPLYDGMRSWLELVAPLYGNNNICIKAYAALALFEFVQYGTLENLDFLNDALGEHYSDNGAYSEGAGYSLYIWEDVPYLLAALKDAMKSKNIKLNVNKKFLKSAENMWKYSRPVAKIENGVTSGSLGLIPVEIDDGCTYNPDYFVWAKLLDDSKYVSLAERFPVRDSAKVTPMNVFGIAVDNETFYSEITEPPSIIGSRRGDDVVMIVKERLLDDERKDTVSLSMVVESGGLWRNGQGHDQQDNLSITLASSENGFILQDRGYSGFTDRSTTHRYYQHNVLTRARNGFVCQPPFTETCIDTYMGGDNEVILFDDLKSRTNKAVGHSTGFFAYTIEFLLSQDDFSYLGEGADYLKIYGGEPAVLMNTALTGGSLGYSPKLGGVEAYTAKLGFSGFYRTIMFFGGSFWVIDRTPETGLVWLANSPKSDWGSLGINLYASSSLTKFPNVGGSGQIIVQNDYDNFGNKKVLLNYWYALHDMNAKTYVLNYPLGNLTFTKTNEKCPVDCQCFVSVQGPYKLVVPPMGEPFKMDDAFDGFADRFKSDAIVLGEYFDNGRWDFIYINGSYWGYKDSEPSSSSDSSVDKKTIDLPGKRLLLMLR